MITSAISLAVLSTAGFVVVYKKLPRKIRRWISRHGLLADISALFLTYMLLGGTLTALMASALVGLFTSALLYISQNPEDFEYLDTIAEMIKDQLNKLKQMSKEFGQAYREKKLMEAKSAC